MPERTFTADEAAERLKVTPATVRGWMRDRKLDAYKLAGAEWRVSGKALNAFLARDFQPAEPSEEAGERS